MRFIHRVLVHLLADRSPFFTDGSSESHILNWPSHGIYSRSESRSVVSYFCDPMDYTLHGILQVRTLEWVAFPFSKGSSQPRDWTQVSHITGGFLYQLSHKGSPRILEWVAYPFSSKSSWPRNRTGVSCIAGRFSTNRAIKQQKPIY